MQRIMKKKFSRLILNILYLSITILVIMKLCIKKSANVQTYSKIQREYSIEPGCFNLLGQEANTIFVQTKQLKKHPPCSSEDWVYVDADGKLFHNTDYLKQQGYVIKHCNYSSIHWLSDNKVRKSESALIGNGESLNLDAEFFQIECKLDTSNIDQKNITYNTTFARIFKQNSQYNARKIKANKQPINVVMLSLDSVSRENWLSLLPKSSKYLLETLKSNILNGYNIVGDGTPAALIPVI